MFIHPYFMYIRIVQRPLASKKSLVIYPSLACRIGWRQRATCTEVVRAMWVKGLNATKGQGQVDFSRLLVNMQYISTTSIILKEFIPSQARSSWHGHPQESLPNGPWGAFKFSILYISTWNNEALCQEYLEDHPPGETPKVARSSWSIHKIKSSIRYLGGEIEFA